MIAQDPIQYKNNAARAAELKAKATPIFESIMWHPNVLDAIEIAKRQRGRRLVRVMIAIDHTGDTCEAMQASVTHVPLPKPGLKEDGTPKSKYQIGKYYVGCGSNPNFPSIISGPFDGAVPTLEGHTLYWFDAKYGLVKVE